jgi:hypothetical protein
VTPQPGIIIFTSLPPIGGVNTPYFFQFTLSGGRAPFTFSCDQPCNLPPGLSLNTTNGLLTGTPTTSGTYIFIVRVQDNFGGNGTSIVSIVIQPAGVPIATVTPFLLPTLTPVPSATPVPLVGTLVGARGLVVRTGPYLGASFVTRILPEQPYPVLARSNDEGVFPWYLIQVNERQGWVSGRYFQLQFDPNLVPLIGNIFDTLDTNVTTGVIGATRSTMNIRRRPSQRTQLLGQVPWGDQVEILYRTRQGRRDFWYLVRYTDGDQVIVGWILGAFVSVPGGTGDIPIR